MYSNFVLYVLQLFLKYIPNMCFILQLFYFYNPTMCNMFSNYLYNVIQLCLKCTSTIVLSILCTQSMFIIMCSFTQTMYIRYFNYMYYIFQICILCNSTVHYILQLGVLCFRFLWSTYSKFAWNILKSLCLHTPIICFTYSSFCSLQLCLLYSNYVYCVF